MMKAMIQSTMVLTFFLGIGSTLLAQTELHDLQPRFDNDPLNEFQPTPPPVQNNLPATSWEITPGVQGGVINPNIQFSPDVFTPEEQQQLNEQWNNNQVGVQVITD